MATRVTLPPLDPASGAHRSPDQAVPVAKVQLLNDRGDRQAEAAWLDGARRPGIVQLLSTSDEPFTIVTAHAGSRTMRTARLTPDPGLDLLIGVAELLASLHQDGFVHGKITVDHVIVGPDGPVLCSPDGTATTPAADLEGMARCMRELGRQWDEAGTTAPWRSTWDDLAQRLEDATDPSQSAVRTMRALRRMAALTALPTPKADRGPRHVPRGLAAAASAVGLAIAGIALVPTNERAAPTGPEIHVDGSIYAVGDVGDDVAYLEEPCDQGAPVVALRPSTGEIWAFRSVEDGAGSVSLAVVPGATELRSEQRNRDDRDCDVAVARGPAGASEIDTASLIDGAPTIQDGSMGDG